MPNQYLFVRLYSYNPTPTITICADLPELLVQAEYHGVFSRNTEGEPYLTYGRDYLVAATFPEDLAQAILALKNL